MIPLTWRSMMSWRPDAADDVFAEDVKILYNIGNNLYTNYKTTILVKI